jgi:hypothetical protein
MADTPIEAGAPLAMVERAMLAGDREDSAMRGEPSPHDPNYFPLGEEGADTFRLERLAVYREALCAALDSNHEPTVALFARMIRVTGGDARSVISALRGNIEATAQGDAASHE